MAGDGFAEAVRRQLRLGALLPLGAEDEGAWLAEKAATGVLRAAVGRAVPGVRLDAVRISPADPERQAAGRRTEASGGEPSGQPDGEPGRPTVPAPPTALPPGPLLLEADFAAPAHRPLPAVARELRAALLDTAANRLGLHVTTADLRATDLVDASGPESADSTYERNARAHARTADTEDAGGNGGTEEDETARPPAPADCPRGSATGEAVIAVPGVTRLAALLGRGFGGLPHSDAVQVVDTEGGGRHVRVQFAVAEDARVPEVARAVRRAAAKAAAWDAEAESQAGAESAETPARVRVTVAAVVTAVDRVAAPSPGEGEREAGAPEPS